MLPGVAADLPPCDWPHSTKETMRWWHLHLKQELRSGMGRSIPSRGNFYANFAQSYRKVLNPLCLEDGD